MFSWFSNATVRTARRIVIGIVGGTIILAGLAMLVLPGPGIVVIGAGFALLSLEFAFAKRWMRIVRDRTKQAADNARIPKWLGGTLIVGGLLLGVVLMIIPGCVSVVSTPEGYEFVRRDRFTYAHAWTSVESLERAVERGDEGAARLLQSIERRP